MSKYTPEILRPIIEDSRSCAEVLRRLGLKVTGGSQTHIRRLIREYGLDISHFMGQGSNQGLWHRGGPDKRTANDILVMRDPLAFPEKPVLLKRALLETGREHVCEICKSKPEWMGKSLSLQIDHINGQKHDNRRENLRFTCPNCHSQTETFGRRKMNVWRRGEMVDTQP